jgi:hypothetical protein
MMPALRGLCVANNGSSWCWDACNLAHPPEAYSVNASTQAGMALLVQQVRSNLNAAIPCPGIQTTVGCNVGQRCTPPLLTLDRGMCVLNGAPQTPQCLDMCDMNIDLATFKNTPGKQAGTVNTVQLVRSGHDPIGKTTCPGPSVWVWLWFPILLCLCIGCCGIAYYMYQFYRKRLKGIPKRDVDMENDTPFMQPPPQDFQDFQPQPDYQQVANKEMPLDYPGDYPPTADKDMLPPFPDMQDQPPVMEPQYMEPPVMAPAPVAVPIVEPVQPVYNTELFGQPSLLSQQVQAAPSTFYTSQAAQPYPAYSYAQPAATATSYTMAGTMPMTQYTQYPTAQYTTQPTTAAYYAAQPSASMRIG